MSGARLSPSRCAPPSGGRREAPGGVMKHAVKPITFVGSTAAKRWAIVMSVAAAASADEGARS
jgi:hypothetical protein